MELTLLRLLSDESLLAYETSQRRFGFTKTCAAITTTTYGDIVDRKPLALVQLLFVSYLEVDHTSFVHQRSIVMRIDKSFTRRYMVIFAL